MRRWQVRANPDKSWGDKGPDLLRTRSNARGVIKADLEHDDGWYVRVDLGDGFRKWQGPLRRAELLEAFDDWRPGDKDVAQWGRKHDGEHKVAGAVRCRVIRVDNLNGTTNETDVAAALAFAAFPAAAFGGGFVCKTISGSSPPRYSQHAHGQAVDVSAYAANDRATDWCLRMARENAEGDTLLPVNQVLGSQGGKVGNASAPYVGPWSWRQGGVDSSHEWHVHLSCGRSQGSGVPACAKGKAALDVAAGPDYAVEAEGELEQVEE